MPTPRSIPWCNRSIRDEEIVADELAAVAELFGRLSPCFPVVLGGGAVLDRDDREALDELLPEARQLARLLLTPFEAVDAVFEDLAHRRVERDRHAVTVAGALDHLEQRLDPRLARLGR